MKEARRIHESLRCVKAVMFATLVSRSMPRGRRAPLHDGTRVREATMRVAGKKASLLGLLAKMLRGGVADEGTI